MRTQNLKRVAIALLLALIGLVVYTYAYEYTHQAKIEAELNTTKYQLEQQSKDNQLKEQESQNLKNKIQQLEADLQARNAEKVRIASLQQKTAHASSVKPIAYSLPANQAKAYIYQHESGNNPAAVNSIGCRGLGQACPGSKLPCSNTDYACQDAWFTNYAISRYGSWEKAYSFWIVHRWW